jgi:4-hydroxy-tetrahydrodipicolinate synthase
VRATVDAANGRAAVACGLPCRNTRRTIDDVRRAGDLGAIGVQIDLPFLKFPTQDDIVRFYTEISDAVDIGIIINNAFWFGAPAITTESIMRLKGAGQVVAFKWISQDPAQYNDMTKFVDAFNVIDNSGQPIRCHQNGGHGYVEGTFAVYPPHGLRVWERIQAGQYDEAQSLMNRVDGALAAWRATLDPRYGGDRVGKAMMQAMGFAAGDPLSPTIPLSPVEKDSLRDVLRGLGWPVVG